MNEKMIAVWRARGRLAAAERKLDRKLERLGLDMRTETGVLIEKMLELIEKKRRLAELAELCRRMSAVMDKDESDILTRVARGESHTEIARETGLSLRRVRDLCLSAEEKGEAVMRTAGAHDGSTHPLHTF